ncbi:MAG: hypothetical protein ACRDS1_18040 [Pseudonocardiaceae bacterium]
MTTRSSPRRCILSCCRLPGIFAARLLRGVMLPSGRIVGETDRVVHLFPLPTEWTIPDELPAFRGLVIRPRWAELVTVGAGMPCVACVLAAPDPGHPDGITELRADTLTTEHVPGMSVGHRGPELPQKMIIAI